MASNKMINKFSALAGSDSDDDDKPIMTKREVLARAAKLHAATTGVKLAKSQAKKHPAAKKEIVDVKSVPFFVENGQKKSRKQKSSASTKISQAKTENLQDQDGFDIDENNPEIKTSDDEFHEALLESKVEFEKDQHQIKQSEKELKIALRKSMHENRYSGNADSSASSAGNTYTENGQINGSVVNHSFQSDEIVALKVLAEEQHSDIAELKDKLAKSKVRIRLCLQLLNDAEYKEKADLLIENHKLKKVNEDLSSELCMLKVENEQLRSKNHGMENEMKKFTAAGK